MPKVRNVSETPTTRERIVSLRDNKLVVVTDGKRRVLLTRAVLKRSYDVSHFLNVAYNFLSHYLPNRKPWRLYPLTSPLYQKIVR